MKKIKYLFMLIACGFTMQSVYAQCDATFTFTTWQNYHDFYFNDSTRNVYDKVTWDFGDGNTRTDTTNLQSVKHRYTKYGVYNVCRIVENTRTSCKDTFCDSVVYSKPTCFGDFTYTISGNTVSFKSTMKNATSWSWSFGDSTRNGYSRLQNPTYTYTSGGIYTVCLYSYSSNGSYHCDDTVCKVITIPTTGKSCKASFTYNLNSRNQATFTNLSTNAVYSKWYFGDGKTSQMTNPVHTYTSLIRPITVCLVIEDSLKTCKDSTCMVIGGTKCDAEFIGSNEGKGKVQFDVLDSRNGVAYNWDFGDGNTYSNMGRNHPNHQYNTANLPDTFRVCLNIYDSLTGCRDTFCRDIYVTNDSCFATFTYQKTSNGVVFFGATGNRNATYSWNFGDGNTSNSQYPTHAYAKKGTYHPVLVVYDSALRCSYTVTDSIIIDSVFCSVKPDFTFLVVDSTGYFYNASTQGNSYKWIYPSGYTDSSYNSTNTFRGPGKYTVCLVAYDTLRNCSDTICKTVVVDSVKSCMAFFRIALDTTKKFKLFLINGSTNKSSHTYKWTFGDGNSSNKRNPSHKYTKFGKYQVCLTVSDTNNRCTDTYCDSLGLDSSGRLLKADGFELVVIEDNLSIPELPNVNYTLFPNPTSGVVTVKLDDVGRQGAYVQVYSLTGELVKNESLENISSLKLDMADTENGMYVVRIFDGSNHTQTKLIKMYK